MKVTIQTGSDGKPVISVTGKDPVKVAIAYGKVLDAAYPRWIESNGAIKKLKREDN